jgi:murein L,D-transpeptidase YcbB/YkuD
VSPDGIVRPPTLKALNVPATVRLAQLRTNLRAAAQPEWPSRQPVRGLQHPGGPDRGDWERRRCRGTRRWSSRTARRPTSIPKIIEINFNPCLTVLLSIVRRDLIPEDAGGA